MTKRIYIVIGSSGSYEEFSTWMVRAFTAKRAANIYAEECRKGYRQALYRYNKDKDRYLLNDPRNLADPHMKFYPDNTRYNVEVLQLVDGIEKEMEITS